MNKTIGNVYELKKELAEIYAKELVGHMKQWLENESSYFGYFIRNRNASESNKYGEAFTIPKEWPIDLSILFAVSKDD